MIYAFRDSGDGYYQVEVAEGEHLPEWTSSLTPCDVLPPHQPPVSDESPVDKLRAFLSSNPDVAQLINGVE